MERELLLRQLGEALQSDAQLNAYALIDPMLREPLDADTLSWPGCQPIPLPLKHPALAADQVPRLIPLPPRATSVLQATVHGALDEQASVALEREQGFAIGGWLLTEAGPDEVARHLANISYCMVERVGKRYLRWSDRRVLNWLWPKLEQTQQARLLGPIRCWRTIDRNGLVQSCSLLRGTSSAQRGGLALSATQWKIAVQCDVGQQLLRGWQTFQPALPADHEFQAMQAVSAVGSLGVTQSADIVLLGSYLLQIHPQLCNHPLVADTVRRALADGTPLAIALESIPDPEGWDDIRDQLQYHNSSSISLRKERADREQ